MMRHKEWNNLKALQHLQKDRNDEFSKIIIAKPTIFFVHKEHSHLFKIQIMLLLELVQL